MINWTSIEFCAGAGGQALGLEQAGFRHALLVDNDAACCASLRANRPDWRVVCADMRGLGDLDVPAVDLLAAGLPCPPFSVAGKQLGQADERDLFPAALKLVAANRPRAVLIENVRGSLSPMFKDYRDDILRQFRSLGYAADWRLYDAQAFGVSQARARVAIVAMQRDIWPLFRFPQGVAAQPPGVGAVLRDLMAERGWEGAAAWAREATGIAPTIVGGSKKHGGPDLGPTRARAAWAAMGVNGSTIAEEAPEPGFDGTPRLTNRMVARLQGFPDDWTFVGGKTAAYRQIGNAFPPPVARALGRTISSALRAYDATRDKVDFAAE